MRLLKNILCLSLVLGLGANVVYAESVAVKGSLPKASGSTSGTKFYNGSGTKFYNQDKTKFYNPDKTNFFPQVKFSWPKWEFPKFFDTPKGQPAQDSETIKSTGLNLTPIKKLLMEYQRTGKVNTKKAMKIAMDAKAKADQKRLEAEAAVREMEQGYSGG